MTGEPAIAPILAALRGELHRPRLTTYDRDGGRTELSGTALLNWASKVAGLLVDELGLGHGFTATVLSRTGWQTAGIVLGVLWAGGTVTDQDDSEADAAFVDDGSDAAAAEVFVVSGHPFGAPSRQVAAHQRDYSTAVMGQADRFGSRGPVAADLIALRPDNGPAVTVAQLHTALTAPFDLAPGSRLLQSGDWQLSGGADSGLVRGLLRPLAADVSLIQHADTPDPAALASRIRAERADQVRTL